MNDTSRTFFVDVPESDIHESPVAASEIATAAELEHMHAVDRVFEELEASLFRLDVTGETPGSHAWMRGCLSPRTR